MMVVLLLHGYASGLYSSRRIAKACRERNDFVMIVALDAPDFRTISDFRKRHLKALEALFVQVLKLCETAGLVKLGHVALDGTKIKANASKHKAMSYERMKKREAELKAEVARMLAAAEAADAEEDATFGKDKRGDEMPDWAVGDDPRLFVIRPVTRLASSSHGLRGQNLKGSRVIHTVAYRILRMTHAENRRSAVRKIRGVAYALTQQISSTSYERVSNSQLELKA
ncbi:hypothetical protein AJ87_10625 [Rhizobium yanglingense]|nr:hypothetical protein AJ87_10625 [Rhizobium yanglingense]